MNHKKGAVCDCPFFIALQLVSAGRIFRLAARFLCACCEGLICSRRHIYRYLNSGLLDRCCLIGGGCNSLRGLSGNSRLHLGFRCTLCRKLALATTTLSWIIRCAARRARYMWLGSWQATSDGALQVIRCGG